MPDQATQTDPQEGKWGVQPGKFLRLASAMYKDEDLTITRRFGDLHMLRILGLQSELDELRNKFLALCAEAREPDYEAMPYNYLAVDPLREEVHLAAKQHRKRQEEEKRELNAIIGSKLKEYNEAVLLESQIRALDTPEKADLAYLRAWISPEMGGTNLSSADRSCWGEEHQDDFLYLRSSDSRRNKILAQVNFWARILTFKAWGYKDSSSNQINSHVINLNPEKARVSKRNMEKRLAFSSRLIMALFGGMALIAPTVIMALYPYRNTCLATTAAATVIFALVLAFGARDSTGKDVLAATAAYTAVLVVFLGSSVASS